MIKVRFESVGRDKRTWETEIRELSYPCLYQAIRKRKALASKEIDFEWIDDNTAQIFAGSREVGTFKILQDETTPVRTEA